MKANAYQISGTSIPEVGDEDNLGANTILKYGSGYGLMYDSESTNNFLVFVDDGDNDLLKTVSFDVNPTDNGCTEVRDYANWPTPLHNQICGALYTSDETDGDGYGLVVYEDPDDGTHMKCATIHDTGSALEIGGGNGLGQAKEPFGADIDNLGAPGGLYGATNMVVRDTGQSQWILNHSLSVGGDWLPVIGHVTNSNNGITVKTVKSDFETAPDVSDILVRGDWTNADDHVVSQYANQMAMFYDPDRACTVIFHVWSPNFRLIRKTVGGGSLLNRKLITFWTITVSGDSVTAGDQQYIMHNDHMRTNGINMDYNPGAQQLDACYEPSSNTGFFTTASIAHNPDHSGTTGSYSDYIVPFHGADSSGDFTAYAESNSEKFIGFSNHDATVSAGSAVTVTVKGGINENQSGLTKGAVYYMGDSGVLSTQKPVFSNFIYKAGIATDTTKLLVTADVTGVPQ